MGLENTAVSRLSTGMQTMEAGESSVYFEGGVVRPVTLDFYSQVSVAPERNDCGHRIAASSIFKGEASSKEPGFFESADEKFSGLAKGVIIFLELVIMGLISATACFTFTLGLPGANRGKDDSILGASGLYGPVA